MLDAPRLDNTDFVPASPEKRDIDACMNLPSGRVTLRDGCTYLRIHSGPVSKYDRHGMYGSVAAWLHEQNATSTVRTMLWMTAEVPLTDEVARMVGNMTALETLYMSIGHMNNDDAQVLVRVLGNVQHTLRRLQLWYVPADAACAQAVLRAVGQLKRLRELCVNQCYIDDEGAVTLAGGLQTMYELRELGLSYNAIGERGMRAIAGALQCLPPNQLQHIQLVRTIACDNAARALADALQDMGGLACLDVSGCSITSKGVVQLIQALKGKRRLTRIAVKSIPIGSQGVSALASILPTCPMLYDIDAQACGLSEADASVLKRASSNKWWQPVCVQV